MIELDFSAQAKARHPCPFSGMFDDDPWVAFHGTSSLSESVIEHEGFRCAEPRFSKADIESVLSVFDELHWAGSDLGGFGVLAAFTASDFGRFSAASSKKPCFFAETSFRALLYASQDWAGGETARTVRRAIADLEAFLHDQGLQTDVRLQCWREMSESPNRPGLPGDPSSPDDVTYQTLQSGWDADAARGIRRGVADRPGVRPAAFSEGWLKGRLDSLRSIRERAEADLRGFTHGAVYAVRFVEDDLSRLRYDSAGLYSLAPLPADRIEARARIALDAANCPSDLNVLQLDSKGRCRALLADGVIGRLSRLRQLA